MYEYNLGIRFQAIAKQHAQQAALWFNEDDVVSYGRLNCLANQMARFLIDQGLAGRDVVCLAGTKSVYSFACVIACLKIGASYCVLDQDSPVKRLRKILSVCQPKLLLAEHGLLSNLCEVIETFAIIPIEEDHDKVDTLLHEYDDSNLARTRKITGTTPAYIMYTSGSTGFPKGAVITHQNVLNLITWSRETYGISHEDFLTNLNPLHFDNSVFDFYSALLNGACLVPFSKDEVRDPKRLVEKVDAAGCTLWFSVPSLMIFLQTMKATDGKYLRSVRRFIFGGEGYPIGKLKHLYEVYAGSSEFFNVYGPTECTCICSSYRISHRDFEELQGFPPLGDISDNFAHLILDDEGKMVPDDELGELCLLGPNVGTGYYNDPDRTAAAFVQNPYNTKFRELMYKTGDIVRRSRHDGKLYFYGRRDNQIKHMGYRIELEEIESALHCLDYITEAATLHCTANGLSRIVAVVVSRHEFNDDQLRRDLRQIIPEYMIPTVLCREAKLPKNLNGKVDRRQLAQKYLECETSRKV